MELAPTIIDLLFVQVGVRTLLSSFFIMATPEESIGFAGAIHDQHSALEEMMTSTQEQILDFLQAISEHSTSVHKCHPMKGYVYSRCRCHNLMVES